MQITKEQAIALFGSSAELARALGIKPSAISQWESGEPIPELQAYKIRYELRPDAFRLVCFERSDDERKKQPQKESAA